MKKIPVATVNRLSLYLKCFNDLSGQDVEYVSSEQIAADIGLNPAQVRKDLAYFGKFGRRGFGYHVGSLKENIARILGTNKQWRTAVIGVGNLGKALLMYGGFQKRGFKLVAGFDVSDDRIGWELDGIKIHHMNELEKVIKKEKIEIVIITTPESALAGVIGRLKGTGIKGALNFAGKHPVSDAGFLTRNVDLGLEMEQLTFFITNKQGKE